MNWKRNHFNLLDCFRGCLLFCFLLWTPSVPADETPPRTDGKEENGVILDKTDFVERAEIARNLFSCMTPDDCPLVQHLGILPALQDEFAGFWSDSPLEFLQGVWTVPLRLEQDADTSETVVRNAEGRELWRQFTDFSRKDAGNVLLLCNLATADSWPRRDAFAPDADMGQTPSPPSRTVPPQTNAPSALRFSAIEEPTNNCFRLSFAWDCDGSVEIFAKGVVCTSWVETLVWTNEENFVVTNDTTRWNVVQNFQGSADVWERRGLAAVSAGTGEFVDSHVRIEKAGVYVERDP